ncbi:MAG: radical SAM protein [Bacteroidales bacterium]|nr:radical SAM protein [Bacteroidales bacterium]
MELSKHNIISAIEDSNDYFIVNLLSRNADIISSKEAELIQIGNYPNKKELIDKGYLVDPTIEKQIYHSEYLNFVDTREEDEFQLFFVPGYSCNFDCSYCYQSDYKYPTNGYDINIIDAFFSYVYNKFKDRKKYITLFGGEPLLSNKKHKDYIAYFLQQAANNNLEVAIVTNGFQLEEYLTLLRGVKIREIQVTLDGTIEVHNQRRKLKGGGNTFTKIVNGINQCLSIEIPVNLRVVVDKENINELPALAQFAIDKGWTKSPFFKTQLGRNYELHFCQDNQSRLYTRLEMYKDIYSLLKKHPNIAEFHKPAFSVAKFLFENGELPSPLFDSCPGTKTEWAFDYTGKVYACTATVGKKEEELGSLYPNIIEEKTGIEEWQDRDVLTIGKCGDCNLQLACGGGCASVAKNNHGNLHSPDCRPVKELLELGIGYYRNNS